MQLEQLDNIQLDLEGTAAHLEALRKMLEGHIVFMRHTNATDIDDVESQLNGLAASVSDLRGVARNIRKVA
jgi:hypothetical protein